jgi:hypothetical protein
MSTVDVLGSGDDTARLDGWLGGCRHRGGNRSISEIPVTFVHMSTPVRVMERAKWASVGLREFELDPPGYTATSSRQDTLVLGAEFGAPNPQKILQHMKLQGHAQVYLMARFVGEEWEKALREAAQR